MVEPCLFALGVRIGLKEARGEELGHGEDGVKAVRGNHREGGSIPANNRISIPSALSSPWNRYFLTVSICPSLSISSAKKALKS